MRKIARITLPERTGSGQRQGGIWFSSSNQGCFDFDHGVRCALIVETVVQVEADLEELDQVLGDGRVSRVFDMKDGV